ncbi:MAG: hypothetical protein M3137_01500 [Actinomycetota bacterium]|nr:hypothetical protein [Actinomycetota bacterium]
MVRSTTADRGRGEILDGRLARGEINTDEYRHRIDAMSAGNGERHDVRS